MESAVARGKTDVVETLVEMFLPQLLRPSVTGARTMSCQNHARAARSPRGWTQQNQRAVLLIGLRRMPTRPSHVKRRRKVTRSGSAAYRKTVGNPCVETMHGNATLDLSVQSSLVDPSGATRIGRC